MLTSLIQTTAGTVSTAPFATIALGVGGFSAFSSLLLLFRPLLVGIGRAVLLFIKPHRSREERQARRAQRNAQLIQRMINSSNGPSDAADLRALAARA